MNIRPVRFFHRGAVVSIDDAESTRTVLQWLREDARCTGTKEGCAEGDCGACTVVVGALDASGELVLQPINACIQFLSALDGKALFTVEDLAAADGGLHPVQQSMVDSHGSQCGFCTPGFVMSLWACYQAHQAAGTVPTRQQLADDLSGNLCRCTGYRPILEAGRQMFDAPAVPLAREPVAQVLRALAQAPPLHTARGFHAPRTLTEFAALRLSLPQARVLAGGTDIGLWVTKQMRELGELISINEVAELKCVASSDRQIVIGAAASLESAWQALVAAWPTLREVWLRFASPPIRHAGTMGGNVANGSPIGDAAPVLIALGAQIVLQQGERVRRMALEDFYVDYMVNRLESGEFVHSIEVPSAASAQPAWALRAYKISKRFDSDISAVCAALAVQLQGQRITQVRLAWGGMAATVRRAARAEAAMMGQAWTEATLIAAQAALAHDFKPLSDMRASADYRMQVAQNLLRRFWFETRPDAPLSESAVNVWARQEPV